MEPPRTITANTCFGCNQTFMTREMLRSHVCPKIDMKDPKNKRAYVEATQAMHKRWATEMLVKDAREKWERIRDALNDMPNAEREMFLWSKCVLQTTDIEHVAKQLADMGYDADRDGNISCVSFNNGSLASRQSIMEAALASMGPRKWQSFLFHRGVDKNLNIAQAAEALIRRGYAVSNDGEIYLSDDEAKPHTWPDEWWSMPGPARDYSPFGSVSALPSMSGGVSFRWASGPERTSDVEMVTQEEKVLEEYIHEICEEEEVPVARLNELLRIRRSEGWQNRALMRFLLDEEVSEQDLFPEKFEGEAEE
jgi:hypothetical protein